MFVAGSGDDTITDFKQPGADRMDLSQTTFDFQDINDVYAQATTVGTTTTIDLGGGDTVAVQKCPTKTPSSPPTSSSEVNLSGDAGEVVLRCHSGPVGPTRNDR